MPKLIIFFLSLISLSLCAQDTKHVLFIGNSYTYYNDLPHLLAEAANSAGDFVVYDQNTPSNSTLWSHSTNGQTLGKIMDGNWDYVVLQEQSQRPALSDAFVENNVYPYAQNLSNLIETYNPCAKTIFYMTWGRENGDAANCSTWPPVCTYEGMDDLLKERYLIMAENNNAITSPVGAVWHSLRENYPELVLYAPDGSHPSLLGSYAAAVTFYTTLFQKDPQLISYNSTLSSLEADAIKSTVKAIVFNNLSSWFINSYASVANFTYVDHGNLEYAFTNTSLFSHEYLWDFGDGSYSLDEHPIHSYTTEGIYEVSLTTNFSCEDISVKTQLLNTSLSTIDFTKQNTINVYPNPATNFINFHFPEEISDNVLLDIFDINGQRVSSFRGKDKVDITHLSKGIYFVIFKDHHRVVSSKKLLKN